MDRARKLVAGLKPEAEIELVISGDGRPGPLRNGRRVWSSCWRLSMPGPSCAALDDAHPWQLTERDACTSRARLASFTSLTGTTSSS